VESELGLKELAFGLFGGKVMLSLKLLMGSTIPGKVPPRLGMFRAQIYLSMFSRSLFVGLLHGGACVQ
jgi:hypothetical protein